MKSKPIEWGKIFGNNATENGLVSKVCKQVMWLSIKEEKKSPLKRWVEYLNRRFTIEDIQMAYRHTKGCATTLLGKGKSKLK